MPYITKGRARATLTRKGCHQTLQLPIKCTAEQGQRDCKGTGRLGEAGGRQKESSAEGEGVGKSLCFPQKCFHGD